MSTTSTTSNIEEKEESLVSMLMFRFVPYWPLFLLLTILCGIAGWTYLKFATPLYNAAATILIKDPKKGVDDSKILDAFDMYDSKSIVENEIEIMRSRTLMENVVKQLNLYASVYIKNGFRDELAYTNSPVSIEVQNPDTLSSSGKIPFMYDAAKKLVTIDSQSYAVNTWQRTPYGVLKFNQTGIIPDSTSKALYFTLSNPGDVASDLVDNLSISATSKVSTILDLVFKDKSPDRAKDVLNTLIDAYAKNTISEKNALAAKTLTFIEDRLRYVVADLDSIERTIQQYKSRKGIVDLSAEGRLFLENVGDNDRQVGNINMQLAVLDEVERYVLAKNDKPSIVPATLGINDKVLSDLLQKLYDAELDYGKLKQTMAENNPAVVAVANQIETIRPAILENVRNQKASLEASRKDLYATNGVYTSMMKAIPQKERELVEISRQQTIKNSVYSFLLQKREETALLSSSTVADSRLIDAASASSNPVSPSKSIVLMIAVVVAVALTIAWVCAKELLTGKILFRSDIEKFTRVPVVAEITSVKSKDGIVIANTENSFIAEQFRHLRAAIGLYGKTVSKKKILVTSSIAGEGKSFVATNLAVSLALSGKKVVLLDVDLRSPKTSSIFGLENERGIAEFLQDEDRIEALIKPTSTTPNLSIIPAGNASQNPTELLINGRLAELFAYLEKTYDYIVVDTSPVDPVTDAYVLSEYCNKTLFVIRHGYTPKAMVQLLDENNKIKALHSLAIVFNGVKKRGFIKGNYGFGFGFGYEYVYKKYKSLPARSVKPSMN